ncbi:hypothetical protein HDU99_008815, partial [Rhizoclosmatium hyalinum]
MNAPNTVTDAQLDALLASLSPTSSLSNDVLGSSRSGSAATSGLVEQQRREIQRLVAEQEQFRRASISAQSPTTATTITGQGDAQLEALLFGAQTQSSDPQT